MKPIPEKLYVQYVPDEQATEMLLALQAELKPMIGRGRPVPRAQLHVTVLHIGFVNEVYQQLLQVRPDLEADRLREALGGFVEGVKPLLPAHSALTVSGLEYLGPYGTVPALSLCPDEAFLQAHEACVKCLKEMMESIGILSPENIPYRPRALQVPGRLNPHLSLFKGMERAERLERMAAGYAGKTMAFRLDSLD